MSGDEFDQNNATARGFDLFTADHIFKPVIGALDQHRRPNPLDQFERRLLLEDDDEVDGLERREDFGTCLGGVNRTAIALEPSSRKIAVQTNYQAVTSGARFGQ